jgi:hypothetical protein
VLSKAKKALQAHESAKTCKHIQECVENIRGLHNSDQHGKFFRKADPDSIYPNQQLFRASEKHTKRDAKGSEITQTIVASVGTEVKILFKGVGVSFSPHKLISLTK